MVVKFVDLGLDLPGKNSTTG